MVRRKTAEFVFILLTCLILPFVTDAKSVPAPLPPVEILIAAPNSIPLAPKGKDQLSRPTFRPLGILIKNDTKLLPVTPPLPKSILQPAYRGPQPAASKIIPKAPLKSRDRPLGVLLRISPKNILPSIQHIETNSLNPSPTFSKIDRPTSMVFIHPIAPDASLDRPLGTIFKHEENASRLEPPNPYRINVKNNRLPTPGSVELKSSEKSEQPIHFFADEMDFDRDKGIITAKGNVEVRYGLRTLGANKITYFQNKDTMEASGNVLVREPTGERMFGDQMDISGDLKDAIVHNIGLILKDHSRIAAIGAKRSRGAITELQNAVYSPCKLCPDGPSMQPLWQIKAVKVIHDRNQKTIEYRDARLEFFGYPVAYTPYFRHLDPSIKRKTGFLFPRFANSSDFGGIVETPFFWAMSNHEDMTISPILMTNAYPVLTLEYRKKLRKGELDLNTSITGKTGDEFSTETGKFGVRGHIKAKTRFDLNRTWRWGLDLQRSTDDTYLRRYNLNSPPSLNSQLFLEGFNNQSYFSAKSMLFQGLETDDEQGTSPIILPLIDFNHVGEPDRAGGRFLFDGNILALTRSAGTDTRRLALHSRWENPFRGPYGDLYRFDVGLKTDFYHTNSLTRTGNKSEYTGVAYRLFPYANLEWQLPFLKSDGATRQTLEPVASIAIAPNGGNPDKIPNEDSTDFEFDETSIFSINRFGGIDRVEGGPRINYGLKWGIFGSDSSSSTAFIGQTYRFRTDSTFSSGSGLEENLSDIVGSLSISPGSHLNLLYRTRFASNNFSPNRNELNIIAGVPAAQISANYLFLDPQMDSEFAGREEANLTFSTNVDRYWRANLNTVQDIQRNEVRSIGLNATYEDECTVLVSSIKRTFFEDRDLKPNDALTFHLVLKTIGEIKNSTRISSN